MSISKIDKFKEGIKVLIAHPANVISLGFGVGLVPVGPGTFGTLLAFPIYHVLASNLSEGNMILVFIAMFIIGVWAAGKTNDFVGKHDSGIIVWDEIVAFCVVLYFTPTGVIWQALAFSLFRFFDIVKTYPINILDKKLKNGFGVMLDDLLAAFYALLSLALLKSITEFI